MKSIIFDQETRTFSVVEDQREFGVKEVAGNVGGHLGKHAAKYAAGAGTIVGGVIGAKKASKNAYQAAIASGASEEEAQAAAKKARMKGALKGAAIGGATGAVTAGAGKFGVRAVKNIYDTRELRKTPGLATAQQIKDSSVMGGIKKAAINTFDHRPGFLRKKK